MSGDADLRALLPWHVVREDGVWLMPREKGLADAERKVVEWHPQADDSMPALPLPFTAAELAAFMMAGGGAINLPMVSPKDFGPSAKTAREALIGARWLRRKAMRRFGTDDSGLRKAAAWLLTDGRLETPPAGAKGAHPVVAQDKPSRARGLTSCELATVFGGYKWTAARWGKELKRGSGWLHGCKLKPGTGGVRGAPAEFDPVAVAACLAGWRGSLKGSHIQERQLDRLFELRGELAPWLVAWEAERRRRRVG